MNHKYCIEYDGISGAEFANTNRLIINGIPYAEKEKGHWIPVYGRNGKTIMSYKCSVCEFHPKRAIITDFCGGCGADMRGGVKSFYDRMTEELGEDWDVPADMKGGE